jgi:hypothetical protein
MGPVYRYFLGWMLLLGLHSCLPDRESVIPTPSNDTLDTAPALLINEIVSNGSTDLNEFGSPEDWIELYNPGNQPVVIQENEWYVTDAVGTDDLQYALPTLTIEAKGFLIIWCDDMDTVAAQIHSNFKLSSSGETVGLVRIEDGNALMVDTMRYTSGISDGASEGRYPDGGPDWLIFQLPTPGNKNQ